MMSVAWGIVLFIATGVIAFFAGRFVLKTKTQIQTEQNTEDIGELKKCNKTVMKSLLAILLAVTEKKINGECDDALGDLKDYLTNK